MNLKQRMRLNDLDPRDPDHDALEDLQARWEQQYMEEYAEHGTMAGEDVTELEQDTQLEKLREKALALLVSDVTTPSQMAEAWRDYGKRLYALINEAANEVVITNWDEIKQDEMDQYHGL